MVSIDGRGDGKGLIIARGLGKTYRRGGEEIHVLQGLNLDVDAGDFVAFMGPSGSGKTTLLKLLVGVHVQWAVSVNVASDEDTRMCGGDRRLARPRRVRFQMRWPDSRAHRVLGRPAPLLLTSLSGGPAPTRRSTACWAGRMRHCLTAPGWTEGGVGIARAIVADPTFLLCDSRRATSTGRAPTRFSICSTAWS
jgi:putative ABC transport system ATP-binding protein